MKKDKKEIFTALLFSGFLYFVGAIDFTSPISYFVIIALLIILGVPIFNLLKTRFKR